MHTKTCLALAASLTALLGTSVAHADAIAGQGTWENSLQARDINGDGKTDAYYDTSTNLTWLADANAALTRPDYFVPSPDLSSIPVNSSGTGSYMMGLGTWVEKIDVYGITGWRLPSVVDQSSCGRATSQTPCVIAIVPGTSELEQLLTVTLGNASGQLTNTGPFRGVADGTYWTKTVAGVYWGDGTYIWTYNTTTGQHAIADNWSGRAMGWAVRTGDVQAVPEPSTTGLVLMGGILSIVVARRRPARQS